MDSIEFVPTDGSEKTFVRALVDTGGEETIVKVGRGVLFGLMMVALAILVP